MGLKQQQQDTSLERAAQEHALLLQVGKTLVEALGKMFAPTCEVVLHDLARPANAVVAIENAISGRKVGDATTEIGLSRVRDRNFPDVLQNYANQFPDGRPAKSTSIGLRNSSGQCVAAICLNMDIGLLGSAQSLLTQMTATAIGASTGESLRSRTLSDVRDSLDAFAAKRGVQPRALATDQRREAIIMLADDGLLQLRGGAGIAADVLGISRATVYNALNHRTERSRQGACDD